MTVQHITQISIQATHCRCRVDPPEYTGQPRHLNYRKAVPDDRSLGWHQAARLAINRIHGTAPNPELERLGLAHDAPAPILMEDVLNGITTPFKL